MTAPRICVVGSVNLDFVASCERLPLPGETIGGARLDRVPGGKGANQALAARRLGAEVRLVACVGDDSIADEALKQLDAAGVDTSGVRRSDAPTGLALIVVAASGENQIVVAPGANWELSPDAVEIEPDEAVICQLEVSVPVVERAAERSRRFFCLNVAPALPLPRELVARADLVVANEHEYSLVADAALGLVALTQGASGALLLEGGREVARAVPPPVLAVDGTAAGDAFCAAIVVSLLEGRPREEALRRACAAGALAASRAGAQPSLPTGDEVDAILAA
jgi:ribokinase